MEFGSNDRLLRRVEVESVTGLGCSSIYALIDHANPEDGFPKPVKIGHRSRWLESEVREWLGRRVELRDQQAV
jgi:prophage regulatory protein